jgi:hypothetical protein
MLSQKWLTPRYSVPDTGLKGIPCPGVDLKRFHGLTHGVEPFSSSEMMRSVMICAMSIVMVIAP